MIKYQLVVKTNQYTGNFEIELGTYVFGTFSESMHGDIQRLDNEELSDCLDHFYDEHGETSYEISGAKAHDLIFFFVKDPRPFLDLIKERLASFPEALEKSWEFATKGVKILGLELYKVIETKEQVKI